MTGGASTTATSGGAEKGAVKASRQTPLHEEGCEVIGLLSWSLGQV